MSWTTIIWSMVGSVCVTLATIYFVVWWKDRTPRAHLLFALTAASTAAFAFCELWMMRAQTPEELDLAMRWCHVPLLFWFLSLIWFVRVYLDAGRLWLAWTSCGLRVLFVLPLLIGENPNLSEIPSLQHVQFLGESLTVNRGVPNPWALLGTFSAFVILVFVADASLTAWRRGDRRKALIVGGSVEFFLITGLVTSVSIIWASLRLPQALSLYFMGLIAVMGYELSREVLRASQLVRDLQLSEAVLRENQTTLQASHKQISELFGRLIGAQETERRRIARDLHDDVSQRISGLSIMISGLKRALSRHSDEAEIMLTLTTMQQNTTALAEEIRDLSHDLHPGVLQHAGLVTALRTSCAQFEKQHAIAVTFNPGPHIGQVEAAPALCLYRVAQEALRNVAKHADAHRVSVELTRTEDGLQLSITDDGNGFDLAEMRRRGAGLGVVSIEERVRILRGSVHIETQHGGGTQLKIRIPLPHEIAATHEASPGIPNLVNVPD